MAKRRSLWRTPRAKHTHRTSRQSDRSSLFHRHDHIEELESRLVLSALFNEGDADDQIYTLPATPGTIEIRPINTHTFTIDNLADDGTFDDTNFSFSGNTVTINLGDGSDVVTFKNLTGTNLENKLTLVGGAGEDRLEGSTEDSTWNITGAGAGNVGGIAFKQFENLTGGAANEDQFNFYAAGSISGTVDGGAGGNDSLSLMDGHFAVVNFTAINSDVGTIRRDGDLITFQDLEPATDATSGAKLVTDTTGASNITVLGIGPTVSVSGNNFPETFVFTDPDSVTVNAGSGVDRITIRSDAALPGTVPVTVNAGDENDTVVLAVPAPSAMFSLFGDAGEDSIVFSSTAALTLTNSELRLDSQAAGAGSSLNSFQRAVIEATTLNSAGFGGQLIFTAGVPDWVPEGPGALTGGQVRITPNNPVVGAIHEVAVRPADLSSLYVGTVGGGVWRNSDISVLFEFALTTLTADAVARLNSFADFLKANPTLPVSIVGHTDNVGDPGFNLTLSQDRALAVKNHLIGQGVEAARLTHSGLGITAPVATNTTEAGRTQNRRVELVVNHWVPLTDFFPSLSISALEISPLDALGAAVTGSTPTNQLVVFAGTGAISNGARALASAGSPASVGLMKSIDGGSTWTLNRSFKGSTIHAIQVLSNGNVLVATDANNASTSGLFLSTDGGNNFIDVNLATAGFPTDLLDNDGDGTTDEVDEAFPAAAVSDIVLDPGNPLRAYAGVVGQGVFVTNNGGLSWNPVNNGIVSPGSTSRLVLAVSPVVDPTTGNHPVYAATISQTGLLNGGSATGSLTIQVPANTVVEAGDTIELSGAQNDGVDNDSANGVDDAAEGAIREQWNVALVGPIVAGNRTITLTAANADGLDNDQDNVTDAGTEVAVAGQGHFSPWGAGATVTITPGFIVSRLAGVFRSDDLGANWTAMTLPGSNEPSTGFIGVNTGAQAGNNLSMVADPVDPDVIYIGGDRQPLPARPNSVGAIDFTGRLFRGDAGTNTWHSITDNGANNSAPHADSRAMVFRGLHILEVDDGGIYELRNADSAARTWRSLNDDLALTEFYSLAFDPVNNIILGGTQDIGTGIQSAPNSQTWNTLSAGDGTIVGFDGVNPVFANPQLGAFTTFQTPILSAAAAGAPFVTIASGSPIVVNDRITLGRFFETVTAINNVGGNDQLTIQGGVTAAVPAGEMVSLTPRLTVANPPAAGLTAIQEAQFVNPFVLNSVAPGNLLIGTNFVYESTNTGRTVTLLATNSGGSSIGQVTPMIYGGRQPDGLGGFTTHSDVIYVGTDPTAGTTLPAAPDNEPLWVRLAAPVAGANVLGALTPIPSFKTEGGSAVVDIAIDPDDWRKVFVLDARGRIWFSPNAGQTAMFDANGAAGATNVWKELTADLKSLPGTKLLQQIAVETSGGNTIVLVGGQGGVFRMIGTGPWHKYGDGLPSALTTSLERIGGADDLLLAGTFGRGAWTIPNASQTLAVPGSLTISGTGGNDVFILERSLQTPWLLDVFQFLDGEAQPDQPSFSVPYLSLASINIDAGAGNDRIVINPAAGAISSQPIIIEGGVGTDTLELKSPADPTVVSFDSGVLVSGPQSGVHVATMTNVFGGVLTQVVSWTGVETANDTAITVSTVVDVIGQGLDLLSEALSDGMVNALDAINLPGINARSLVSALNGALVNRLRPKDDPFVPTSQVPGSSQIQIDDGKSVLLRILEAGGLNLDSIGTGLLTDATALELALENLDSTPNNVDKFDTDQPFDADLDPDLLFHVNVVGVELKGVLDLDVASEILGGLGNVALSGLLDVEMTLDLSIAFGVDSTGFFIRTAGPLLPKLKITDLAISGEAVGGGRFGFLEIDVTDATLALDPGVELAFQLLDPGTNAADGLIRAPEFSLPDPTDLISFAATTDGDATADLILDAQVEVAAILPGIPSGISLAEAGIKFSWASISNPAQVAVAAGANAGADVAEFLRFLEVTGSNVLTQLESLRDNIVAVSAAGDALLGIEIPYVPAVLDDLISALEAFNDKILDPLNNIASGGSFDITAQRLVLLLANAIGVDPAELALAYNKLSDELTWHVEFDHDFATSPHLELDFDIANLAQITASADVDISGTVSFEFDLGVDLGDLFADVPLASAFFLRDASVFVEGSIDATGINANARLGFLDVSVVNGAFHTTDLAMTLPLSDPDGTDADDAGDTDGGRITLAELIANIATPGNLIGTPTLTGSLTATLPLAASFGSLVISASPDTTLTVEMPDLNDPSNIQFAPISNPLQDLLNFKNMSAAEFVSLIGVLADQLQDLRNTEFFTDINIPFVEGAVNTVLDFAESISDGLLYDDGADDVKDGANRLVTDLNAALASAGLAPVIAVQGDGTNIVFEVLDRTVTGFKIEAATGDAGGFAQLAFTAASIFAMSHQAVPPVGTGKLTNNAKLKFTIKRTGKPDEEVEATLTSAATEDNTEIGDDTIKLLRADNSATFDTAQGLAFRLTTVLGLGNVVDYDGATDALTLNIGALLPKASISKEFPIDFDLDLGPLLGIESNTIVKLQAEAGFDPDFVIGVYLGDTVPGAVSDLGTGTKLVDLNDGDGVDIKTAPAITAPNTVDKLYGRLQNDAHFTLSATVGGVPTDASFTLKASDTSSNTDTAGLIADLNAALAVASVRGKPLPNNVLSGDASFEITIGATTYSVTVLAADTTTNDTLGKLVEDINAALKKANGNTVDLTAGTFLINAQLDGSVVVFQRAGGGSAEFKLKATNSSAETQLGLPTTAVTGKRLNDIVTAVADGNRVLLVAAPSVTALSLATTQNDPAVTELGFQKAQTGKGPLVGSPLDDFDLDFGSATFTLTISGVAYNVTVPQAATTTNTLLAELVADVNTALANAKHSVSGATTNLTSKVVAEGVTGALVLKVVDPALFEVTIASQLDNPTVTELGLTDDDRFTRLSIRGTKDVPQVAGRLAADTTLSFVIDGGSAIPVTLYADDTAANTTILSLVADINQALWVPTIKTGILAGFAPAGITFKVGLNGGTLTDVTVPAVALAGNLTLSDLVKDLNDALDAAGLGEHVVAKPSGASSALGQARVRFEADTNSVTRLEMTALAGNTLDLPTATTATSLAGRLMADSAGNQLVLSAVDSFVHAGGPTVSSFALAADASITIVVSTASGPGTPQVVTVKQADTVGQTRLEDLVADLNAALSAKLDGALRAEVGSGNTVVLRSLDASVTGFQVTSGPSALGISGGTATASTIAAFQVTAGSGAAALGLNVGTSLADDFDLEIRVSNPSVPGQVVRVTLQDNANADIQSVIDAITTATSDVEVVVNEGGTGLTLIDKTFKPVVLDSNGKLISNPNARSFSVMPINGSAAAVGLGIAGVDSLDASNLDGQIDGRQITGIKLTDRFFLRGASLGASLEVTTPTGIDASANFGFIGIDLTGDASLTAELSVGLKDPGTGAADGQISLTEFIAGLSQIDTLLDAPSLTGLGQLDIDVNLAGTIPFITLSNASVGLDVNLGDLFSRWDDLVDLTGASPVRVNDTTFTLTGDFTDEFLSGARVKVGSDFKSFVTGISFAAGTTTVTVLSDAVLPVSLTGLSIGTPNVPEVDFTSSNLENLLSFENVDFGFASIIDSLLVVSKLLSQFDAVQGVLNQPIPLADVSINDLLEFADKFSDALEQAQNDPAGSLQLLDQKISEAFGVDPAGNLLEFSLDDFGTPTNRSDDILKLGLNLGAAFSESLNVRIPDIDLGLVGGAVDLSGAATLGASGGGTFKLDIGVGLSDPTKFYLYDSSNLSGTLALTGSDMAFKAGLGPFSLSVIDGEASIAGTVDVEFFAGHFTNGRKLVTLDNIGGVLTDLAVTLSAPVAVSLPVYFPTESHLVGDITLTGDLTDLDQPSPLFLKTTAAAAPANKIVLDVSDVLTDLTSGLANLSLLDQIQFVVDGVDVVLGGVQDALDGDIMGFSLPLIGDKLADGADVIGDFRAGFLTDFRNEIEKLANPSDNGIKEILFKLLGGSNGLLIKTDGAGNAVKDGDGKFVGGDLSDIQAFSNLDTATSINEAEIYWKVKIGKNLPNTAGDIGLDLGIPGLGLETDGEIQLKVDWELDLGFGLSGKDGFFFFVDDDNELLLSASVTLPNGSLKGTLGFLEFTALNEDVDGDDVDGNTHLGASFAINVLNSSDSSDERLGLSELGRMGFEVLVGAEAAVELAMTLGIAGDDGGFPQIKADFILDWRIDGDPGAPGIQMINLFNPPAGFDFGRSIQDGLQRVEFVTVSLDVGSYITNVVGPLVKKIQEITEPVQPIIDIVTTPLPVISDLGLEITLLDIAKQTGAVDARFIEALETIFEIVSIVNSIEMPADGSLLVPFGNFTIYERSSPLFAGLSGFDLGSGDFDIEGFANQVLAPGGPLGSLISGLPEGLQDVFNEVAGVAGDILTGLAEKSGAGGSKKPFSFPIIEDPSQVFGMLMGKPAVLVAYDMPPLKFDAEFSAFFSIFGPLGVSLNLEAALNIDFAFGYDTKGFTDFADSGFKNPLLLTNGLYVSDDPTNPLFDGSSATGNDLPELTFDGGLWAAAELNLGIARGGVGGGIFIGVDFNLFDNDGDGRVRLEELVGNFLNQLKAPEEAERFLAPLAVFDVTGKVTAELFAFLKIDFGFFELNKKFNITPPMVLSDFAIDFFRPPILASELDNGDLIINIGDFAGQRKLGDQSDFGEHIFIADAGPGKVAVWSDNLDDAGADAKQIYNVSGRIIAIGGEGDDVIDLSGVLAPIKFELDGGVGRDTLKAGAGGGIIRGGIGDDQITGAGGDDLIFGNEGGDTVHAGGGADIVLGDNGEVSEGFDLANRHGFVRALVTLTDGGDELFGEGGDDILVGSGAIDTLEGGDNADILIGDGVLLSFNSPPVVTETDTDTQGFGDTLSGGAGDDVIYGGKGGDAIHGNAGNDIVFGESGIDTIHGDEDNDTLFGDSGRFVSGEPIIVGGGDGDTIFGDAGDDRLLGGGGSDVLHGGDHNDTVWGGIGMDIIHGNAGNDILFGESDPDQLFGDDGNDYLEGGGGNDISKGGAGEDNLVGGYGSDTLDGEADGDLYRITGRGGTTTELTTAYDKGPGGVDQLIFVGTPFADTLLLRAAADAYFPTLAKLNLLVDRFFNATQSDRLAGMLQAIEDAYGPHDLPPGLREVLTIEFQAGLLPGLLQAIADNYVAGPDLPALVTLQDLVTDVFESDADSKLGAMKAAITEAYGSKPVPADMLNDLTSAYQPSGVAKQNALKTVMAPYYEAESIFPRLAGLKWLLQEVFENDDIAADAQLAAMTAALTAAYGSFPMAAHAPAMLGALATAFAATPDNLLLLQDSLTPHYQDDPVAPSSFTDTAFIAMINNGGANVERFNYRNLETMSVDTLAGEDYVVLDDLLASTSINLGLDNDRAQIGQVFRSERVKDLDGAPLISGIRPEDMFTTLEITRGWLSNGVSVATTISGGGGDDEFVVFHNIAVLNLNGNDGDDVFVVRAFALAGSTDSERARTDMKGDGGADTILYAMNAPVGIDGGDGFDTVRIIGTEFSDDFVVTESGVFGAGLNVSYVNIEKLVADGAEGDDRYFVLSTGLDVVTEIDGGLGSDTFFVGGNPSGAPIPVISNDLRGHSGIILHSIESGDTDWAGLKVPGLSVNIGDDDERMILVSESDGRSSVYEGALAGSGLGWEYDTYTIRLSKMPLGLVVIAIAPAALSEDEKARDFRDLEIQDPVTLEWKPAVSVTINNVNWTGQEIRFRAAQDTGIEGRRFAFINHKIDEQLSTDLSYAGVQMLSPKVQIDDDDRDGVVITPSVGNNTVLEGGFADSYDIVLTKAPSAPVKVVMTVQGSPGQVSLSRSVLWFDNNHDADPTDGELWSTAQTIHVTAVDDGTVEGFHTEFISVQLSSADTDLPHALASGDNVVVSGVPKVVGADGFLQVDGDFDLPDVQSIPVTKPTTYVLLPHRPQPGSVSIRINGVVLDGVGEDRRFDVSGNTVSFRTASGTPELRVGKVEAHYTYLETGYHEAPVKDVVVDIYDDNAPAVIIEPIGDGSTDVVEGGISDTYRIRLTTAPQFNVKVVVDAVETRSTWGANAFFEEQVTVGGLSQISLIFTPGNWDDWQIVTVAAIQDTRIDGNDTQVFAPDLQTVNKIRGPLLIEGAAGAGSLTLPAPLMMPWELNLRPSDGNVLAFDAADTREGLETMDVELGDLETVVERLQDDDPTMTLQKLVGKTLEMSRGDGTDVELDPLRPRDRFDRFWLITAVDVGVLGDASRVRLTLQNPTAVDPTLPNVTPPNAESEYAITSLSVNFFADERQQVDYLFMFDNDSVADDTGALTSSDGAVLGYSSSSNTMRVETSALQAVADLLETDLVGLAALQPRLEITVGPGLGRAWTIQGIAEGEPGEKVLTLVPVAGTEGLPAPSDRSEFRIAGSDRHGRIVGFGMGPNTLFAGRPQGGGITYGDIEVVQVSLGSGNDTVRVDYTSNSEDHTTKRSGDFYTLTLLDTGAGNDQVTVALDDGDQNAAGDGALSISLQEGDDDVLGGASTRGIVVFGGDGNDDITTGSGDDIVFGDIGRVDYVRVLDVQEGGTIDEVITRLGHSVTQNPTNPHVTGATLRTIEDATANFPPSDESHFGGLKGLSVQAIDADGHVQFRTIVSNTATTITVDRDWDSLPVFTGLVDDRSFYRVSAYPEDQTDGTFRGPRIVWSINEAVGGNDTVQAGAGNDTVIGGVGIDTMHGNAGEDWIAGDNARLDYVHVTGADGPTSISVVRTTGIAFGDDDVLFGDADKDVLIGGTEDDTMDGGSQSDIVLGDQATLHFSSGNLSSVDDPGTEGDDILTGGSGTDLVIGGLGNDTIDGQADADILIGDAAIAHYAADGTTITRIETLERANALSGVDTIYGGTEDDLVIGGSNSDNLDGGAGRDLIFGDNVFLVSSAGSGDAIDPRFRALSRTTIYGADGVPLVAGPFGSAIQPVPGGRPIWSDWTITLDAELSASQFGNDYIAGGSGDDEIFGQLGNDAIQGDGSIASQVDGLPGTAPVSAARVNGLLVVAASFEDPSDGDDYIEGNGGNDVIFGNLGQDDLIGGSSNLFSLATAALRPDESDLIFGGAGLDVARNEAGDLTSSGHARDADMILGDNGNIYRLVGTQGTNGGSYLTFTYDNYGALKIIPRGAHLLDYTPAGGAGNLGAADELHGESGDDFLYGMSGHDVLFGEGQDDDLFGGWGTDRMFGGAGEDGLVGDNGLVVTSRNGLTEVLLGVTVAHAEETLSVPGPFVGAVEYIAGRLEKAFTTIAWADGQADVMYGGLGDDFVHGGAGDDAISGAEALPAFYNELGIVNVNPLGYVAATRKLAAYDANQPRLKIAGFLLNFEATVASGQKIEDGKDRLFGDTGNDWLVGGTGKDRMFGGAGDDLMNADDNHDTNGGLNNAPDAPQFADGDFVYGGGGLDVLIANTGNDRMVDWKGEFNSFIVPFSPFGMPTVVRSPSPHWQQFIRDLGRTSGADQSLGEPNDELGLTTADTGGPRDPQAGNLGGVARDTQGGPENDRGLVPTPEGSTPAALGASLTATSSSGGSSAVSLVPAAGSALVAADMGDPSNSALYVFGTPQNDVIEVRGGTLNGTLQVMLNGLSLGTYSGNLLKVYVYGEAGDDVITIASSAGPLTAVLEGATGNDRLYGGVGANFIDGGDGNDILQGNRGRDMLFGGGGVDRLLGSMEEDVLCGGIYQFANDAEAVTSLLAEWTRRDLGYAARVQNLKTGLGRTAGFALKIETITDDLLADELFGEQHDDFFLRGDNDRTDVLNKELRLDI